MRSTGMISKNVFIKIMVVFLAILFLYAPTWAKAEEIRVMTRNLYIGAEIQSIAAASTPEAFYEGVQSALEQVAANDFTERAEALAAEIVEKNPHLVGLQEVYNFTIDGTNGPLPFHDYLTILTDMLAIQGAGYRVAAVVKNLDLTILMPGVGSVGVIDRDVILAREDVDTQVVDLTAGGFCRASLDGCNYHVVASAQTTPIGPINFERGVVAVDAVIGTFPVRFFNTHLEVRNVDPTNPLSPVIQAMQAVELTAFLNLPKDENSPVIVVGDLNSSPEHMPVDIFLTPYMQLEFAGYFDVWTLRPGKPKGFTCCQAEDLLNPESILYERVDMIFCSELPINKVQANPVGNDEAYKTPSGLWPSDHAGVVARMEFAP
jgi:endonuclease/exonuclease/phosphatase family metal-dependent hydrolase